MSDTVRARMKVTEITERPAYAQKHPEWRTGKAITMVPVYGRTNAEWEEATPSGNLTLTIQNPTAARIFAVGAEYYVDMHRVPDGDDDAFPDDEA